MNTLDENSLGELEVSKEVIFRSGSNLDIDDIQYVVFSALEEFGLPPDPQGTDIDLSDIETFYFSKNGFFEVCQIQGQVVGTWGLLPISQTTCELRKMYLLPSFRGQGLGHLMLLRFLEKARSLGFAKVYLETASPLIQAVSLYKKYGFKQLIDAKNTVSRCDQAFELNLEMSPSADPLATPGNESAVRTENDR